MAGIDGGGGGKISIPLAPQPLPRRIKTAIAALVALAIVLSGVAFSYYGLASHYYDAKYRAQFEVVQSLVTSLNPTPFQISVMINDSYAMSARLERSLTAEMLLVRAELDARIIEVMYPEGSAEAGTFGKLRVTMDSFHNMVADYRRGLWDHASHDLPYRANDTVNSLFISASDEAKTLTGLLSDGFAERDPYRDPYSLVKRMDLPSINMSCQNLYEILGQFYAIFRPF